MKFFKTVFGHVRLFFTESFYLGKQYDLPDGWEIYVKVRSSIGYYLSYHDKSVEMTIHFPNESGSVTLKADGSKPTIDPNTKLMKVYAVYKKDSVKKVYRMTQINI